MNQLRTAGIVLTRVDYGEADRIITFLTPDSGKITLMAKGVRRLKSKLAGGIELFSISELVYVEGRKGMGTLVSSRLIKHYGHIVEDVERTLFGYELLKMVHKITEEDAENDFYEVLSQAIEALDNSEIDLSFISVWAGAQLLARTGHTPNLLTDTSGEKLVAGKRYDFDFERVAFRRPPEGQGAFGTDQIKFLRILFSENTLVTTRRIEGAPSLAESLSQLITTLRQFYLSV